MDSTSHPHKHSMKTDVTVEPTSHSDNQSHLHQEMTIDADEILAAHNQHAHSCSDPSHHHHHHHHHHHPHSSLFDPEEIYGGPTTEKVKRKPKKSTASNDLRSENIPGHRGDQDIDTLLKFIDGPSTAQSKKGKKK